MEAFEQYFALALFMLIALVISCALLGAGYFLGGTKPNAVKNQPYECGFPAFGNARMKFNVRFYLVAILFIIFDLEIVFLFPWAVSFYEVGWYGYASVAMFLLLLLIGFVYEWKKGALEWH